jgi:hypothetical protein
MALVFCDGFDHYATSDLGKKWTSWTGTGTAGDYDINYGYARAPGGMGIRRLTNIQAGRLMYKTLSSTHTSFIYGMSIMFSAAVPTSTTGPFMAVWDSSSGVSTTYQLCLRGDAGGHLVLAAPVGTILATSSNTFSSGVWYHIELKATINNTTGTYEVRVNGSSTGWIPAATGKNTRGQSANNYIDTLGIGDGAAAGANIDDLYFLSSASPNNDFLGPVKIMTAYPSGAGNYAQWTGNFASNFTNVQELTGDSDSTFNQSATANQIDTFNFDDMPTGTIIATQDVMMARQDAGAARVVRTKYRSGGGTDYNGTSYNMAGSYQFHLDPRDVDPATGSAYTVSNFNAEERGYELVS